jgi:NAD(P)-dependent dehydrogenase (short-subunit alcohol dehydrogenase family)
MGSKLKTIAALGTVGVVAARLVAQQNRAYDLRGKVVFITGASRGLGLVLARQLIREGVTKLAICARDAVELERAREELQRRGANVLALLCDVTDRDQINGAVRQIIAHYGTIDVLINNAGIIQIAPSEVMTEEWDEAMRTHYWAPLYAIRAVLPEMRRKNEGRIVNIASIGGKISTPHMVPYCSSKFALVGLSHGLRAELAEDGVVVITVCPPLVRTGGFYRSVFKGRHRLEFTIGNIANANPLFSISTEQAAQRIIKSLKRGDAETVLSKRAQVLTTIVALFPGLTSDVLALANRALPQPDGPDSIGTRRASGIESMTPTSESALTALNQIAYDENNQQQHEGAVAPPHRTTP